MSLLRLAVRILHSQAEDPVGERDQEGDGRPGREEADAVRLARPDVITLD